MPDSMFSVTISQGFSIPVLAPPRSAYFVCYSYRLRCLFYSNASALRSGHHRILCHDSSSKRTYIFHSKCIEVCKTWIKIVHIYRGIWCHTHPCVKTLRSANPWMNVPKWSNFNGFPCSGRREQWTLCREHVNRNTVHAWSALLTSWLSESGVLTRETCKYAERGARGLELRTSAISTSNDDWPNKQHY